MACTFPSQGQWKHEEAQQGDPSHELHHLQKLMQRTPADYIMWRLAENNDRENLEVKTGEPSVDAATTRAAVVH